jgi:hypothetical protein
MPFLLEGQLLFFTRLCNRQHNLGWFYCLKFLRILTTLKLNCYHTCKHVTACVHAWTQCRPSRTGCLRMKEAFQLYMSDNHILETNYLFISMVIFAR